MTCRSRHSRRTAEYFRSNTPEKQSITVVLSLESNARMESSWFAPDNLFVDWNLAVSFLYEKLGLFLYGL